LARRLRAAPDTKPRISIYCMLIRGLIVRRDRSRALLHPL
jgi:hypothetical protein